jgi:protoheme IX farnesyltransferase
MVGASNAFNQVIEKDLDALMDRTKTVQFLREECLLFSIGCSVLTIVGITLLYMINPKTAMFGAISILYTSFTR